MVVHISLKSVLVCWTVGTAALITIHILSHGAWLPGVRSETITSLVPFGKVLFPLAVLPLSIVLPMMYIVALSGGRVVRPWMAALGVVALAEIAFLFQRGFVIYSPAVMLFAYRKLRGRLPFFSTAAIVCLGALLLFGMRPIVLSFSAPSQSKAVKESKGLIAVLKDNPLLRRHLILKMWAWSFKSTKNRRDLCGVRHSSTTWDVFFHRPPVLSTALKA